MRLHGHFENGIVVLDGGVPPRDGTPVTVTIDEPARPVAETGFPPIPFPLVRCDNAPSVHLTNTMIAELMDDEDASTGR